MPNKGFTLVGFIISQNKITTNKILPYWKSTNVGACLGGTPTLKLSHVGPHPRAGLRFQTTFCRLVGSFAVVGPSERPKDPALVPALPTFARGPHQCTTYSSSILERAAACTVLALLLNRSGRDTHNSSSSTSAEFGRGAQLALLVVPG